MTSASSSAGSLTAGKSTLEDLLPPTLRRLAGLVYNLRWSWQPQVRDVFAAIDAAAWDDCGHNPVGLLKAVGRDRLEELASDRAFLTLLDTYAVDLDAYLKSDATWFQKRLPAATSMLAAYFSAEFGVTECLPIFSGGLGVLAGDHLKSASDLGIPLIGMGLLYRQGYFRQLINERGLQDERYDVTNFEDLPVYLARHHNGDPVTVDVPFPDRTVRVLVWAAHVGRVSLFLLDTDLPDNAPADRLITGRLYGGDIETRIQQELILGIGGCRALDALGLEPTVYHMNEGHAAFLVLERIRAEMSTRGASFETAREVVRATTIFTTHTPVPAGHDYFPPELVERYLGAFAGDLGVPRDTFLALGRKYRDDAREHYCMTVLALKSAGRSNGVSKLHGAVSNDMWRFLFRDGTASRAPINHITNGIHTATWVGREMAEFFTTYLGAGWAERVADPAMWGRIEQVPNAALWRERQSARARLVRYVATRMAGAVARRGQPAPAFGNDSLALNPRALTIGFARRFASYKRATLLLRDPDRLASIMNAPGQPVQFVFAGKAHPRDDGGKALIEQLVALSRRDEFRGRLVFLENYDTAMARQLVSGVDVWLNTPQRPYEASGTSGMKATVNGVLNCSTLDGWWAEAWSDRQLASRPFGWALGSTADYADADRQAADDAEALYTTLEGDIVPAFYHRDHDGVPAQWVGMMKASIVALSPYFNTDRMVREYTERCYVPSSATAPSTD